jgi:hypothetical protein
MRGRALVAAGLLGLAVLTGCDDSGSEIPTNTIGTELDITTSDDPDAFLGESDGDP